MIIHERIDNEYERLYSNLHKKLIHVKTKRKYSEVIQSIYSIDKYIEE